MTARRSKGAPKGKNGKGTGGQFMKDTRGADPRNIPTANTSDGSVTSSPVREVTWAESFHRQLEEARARMLARRELENEHSPVEEIDDEDGFLGSEKCVECTRRADDLCSDCGDWMCSTTRCAKNHEKHCQANAKMRILSRHSCAQLKTTKEDYSSSSHAKTAREREVAYRKRLRTAFLSPVIAGGFSPDEKIYVSFVDMNELDPTNYNDDEDYRYGYVLRMNVRIREDADTDMELLPNPAGNPKWRIADKGCTTSTFIRRGTSVADLEEIARTYADLLEQVLDDAVAYRKQFNFLSYLDSLGDNMDSDTWAWGMSLN